MSIDLNTVLQNKAINQWKLFWLISVPMSVMMLIEIMATDMSAVAGVSHMISFSVRWAVPIIFLVMAISSLQILLPGPLPAWLLRNRKYIGLCFAVAMAWQALFIFIISNFFRGYYFEEIFYLRDELEGSTGYIFLTMMVVTSFKFGRQHLNAKQWKLLHKSALYFLWAYPFSVYWWNLSYYENPQPIDYIFYWSGFLAFALRIAAWGKQRRKAALRNAPQTNTSFAFKLFGGTLITFGLFVASIGLQWQKPLTEFLLTPAWSANLVLWLPFWPFEPYLSLFIIGLGTLWITKTSPTKRLPIEK